MRVLVVNPEAAFDAGTFVSLGPREPGAPRRTKIVGLFRTRVPELRRTFAGERAAHGDGSRRNWRVRSIREQPSGCPDNLPSSGFLVLRRGRVRSNQGGGI
jgi:hypothetical protein